MVTNKDDPRALAQGQFSRTDVFEKGLDLVEKYATDSPRVIDGMLRAVAPTTVPWRMLEVGFGTAWLMEMVLQRYPEATVFGVDLSEAMAETARRKLPRARIARADMEALPFGDRVFDCTASCCALYFARDIERAVRELRRVTRKGGRVAINTVGSDNIREVDALSRRVMGSVALDQVSGRFDLESGLPLVRNVFPDAIVEEWSGTMTLPDAETFVAFWATFHHRELAQGGAPLMQRVLSIAKEFARADGTVVVTRHSGVFVATARGGG